MADIKGKNRKKILNQLRKQYYNLDATWVKCLRLQLPQAPRSNRNIDNMMEHMLQEQKSNKYMQQYIFSVAGIQMGTEGKFSSQFRNIMECARYSEIEISVSHAPLHQVRIRLPTLALKPKGDITRSPEQEYQWLHKKGLMSTKIFL